MADLVCSKCHSHRVKVSYPDIECLACGYSEPLVDYPVSWNCHRNYCHEFGSPDPGCELPEHSIDELHERISALEVRL